MDLDFEQLLAEHREREGKFDPYQIAEDWLASDSGPKLRGYTSTKSDIINHLHILGERITLERIELIQICIEAIQERGTNSEKSQ